MAEAPVFGAGSTEPVRVEIVTYAPTEFFHCLHCEFVWRESGMGRRIHAEQRAAGLPPDLAEQFAQIARWAAALQARYGARIRFRVVDVASFEGMARVLRHRLTRFPAFLIDGTRCVQGADLDQITEAIAARLGRAPGQGCGQA